MKKLCGHLYLYPAPQTDIGALTEHDNECKTYDFITGLLGLSVVPEKWVKVCAFDTEDCFDESKSGDWCHNGYIVEGYSGIFPFPEYLPAVLFKGKREGETLLFNYGDMEISVVLSQYMYSHKPFEEVFNEITSVPPGKDILEIPMPGPGAYGTADLRSDSSRGSLPEKGNHESMELIIGYLPFMAPIMLVPFVPVAGITCCIAAGIAKSLYMIRKNTQTSCSPQDRPV